jgi:2,3-bisphosphoglycerate-dependent phosphoglycerate mutase
MHSTALTLLAAAHVNALRPSLFRKAPQPIQTDANTFTEDDGYKLLAGHREKRWSLAWARNQLRPPKPGKLVLVRHGESSWNRNATFCGWTDVDLSERGEREVEHASRLLLEAGLTVDVAYTSRLRRAIRSSWILLKGLDCVYRPVFKSWRLNERHYGGLTGLSKPRLAEELGEARVQAWRHGLRDRPPPMPANHPLDVSSDRNYADLESTPRTESLEDTMQRALPLWRERIEPDLRSGKTVLVVAHGNSLRGLVKHVDGVSDEAIVDVSIPNGIPLVYSFDRYPSGDLVPHRTQQSVSPHVSGAFLEERGLLRAALEAEAELVRRVPGHFRRKDQPAVRALAKLELERRLIDLAGDPSRLERAVERSKKKQPSVDALYMGLPAERVRARVPPTDAACVPTAFASKDCIVILRHGRTEHNKLGLFTGWEDAGLASEGRAEAKRAGQLLKAHGFAPDVVYTSWLSRSIETAWLALSELDALWVPIIKSWRLNERMYGALTGLSKKAILGEYGESQFKKWRRGYTTRPPAASSFSQSYPGNDERYVRYLTDVRYSLRESLIRSLASGSLVLARKIPRAESLKDCMDRTIPFFTNEIYPRVVDQQRSVLVSSSENAIRGLLMHLCDVPSDRIAEVEIPTGLPMVFDVKRRCLRLLDDGRYPIDPAEALARWNFGTASARRGVSFFTRAMACCVRRPPICAIDAAPARCRRPTAGFALPALRQYGGRRRVPRAAGPRAALGRGAGLPGGLAAALEVCGGRPGRGRAAGRGPEPGVVRTGNGCSEVSRYELSL